MGPTSVHIFYGSSLKFIRQLAPFPSYCIGIVVGHEQIWTVVLISVLPYIFSPLKKLLKRHYDASILIKTKMHISLVIERINV